MRIYCRYAAACSAIALLAGATRAEANVTFSFEGTFSDAAAFTSPIGPVAAGDPMLLTFTFDETTSGSGTYLDAIVTIDAFEIGGWAPPPTAPASFSGILVDSANDTFTAAFDLGTVNLFELQIAVPLSSDDLPTTLTGINFAESGFIVSAEPGETTAIGSIHTFSSTGEPAPIPVPGAVLLGVFGFGLLGAGAGCKRFCS